MKTYLWMLSFALVTLGAVHAQEKVGDSKVTADEKAKVVLQKMLMPSSKLIGASVKDSDGESCGDINAFALDRKGMIHYVLIGIGGIAGVGETEVAVPWTSFQCTCMMEGEKMTCHPKIKLSSKQLKTAPHLKAQNYLELTDADWSSKNSTFFQATRPASPIAKSDLIISSKIIDGKVKGTDKESVGELDELMIMNGTGEVEFFVLGRGGVAGIGESYVAIAFPMLQILGEGKDVTLQYRGNAASLDSATKVTPSEYPELRLRSVAENTKKGESR